MPQYKAPLRDMRFLLNEVFDYTSHYAKQPNAEDATPDVAAPSRMASTMSGVASSALGCLA